MPLNLIGPHGISTCATYHNGELLQLLKIRVLKWGAGEIHDADGITLTKSILPRLSVREYQPEPIKWVQIYNFWKAWNGNGSGND
jgi:hypothetical protein